MRVKRIILWAICILVFILGMIIYSLINGTPWEKSKQSAKMETYLENKYHNEFIVKKIHYNYLSETYQASATPKGHLDVEFMVQQDMDSKAGYSDTYPEAIWKSELSNEMKAKIRDLFPELDEPNFQAMPIVNRGEFFGRGIPTYQQVPASQLETSITIKIIGSWEQMDQELEMAKMKELSQYLQSIHFPVLVEVWYIEDEIKNINENTKAFFITENGNIIEG